jgi:hypothetical protein
MEEDFSFGFEQAGRARIARRTFEELAQNGRDITRATRRPSEFLPGLVARIRALCAFEEESNRFAQWL